MNVTEQLKLATAVWGHFIEGYLTVRQNNHHWFLRREKNDRKIVF